MNQVTIYSGKEYVWYDNKEDQLYVLPFSDTIYFLYKSLMFFTFKPLRELDWIFLGEL